MSALFLFSVLLLSCVMEADSWSYVPISDENLVNKAQSIVVGYVMEKLDPNGIDSRDLNVDGLYTHYLVRVTKALKSDKNLMNKNFAARNDGEVLVSVIGGYDPLEDRTLHVPGVPTFEEGERVILFLNHDEVRYRDDEAASQLYPRTRITEFSLGSFHEVGSFAVRSQESSMNQYEGNEMNFNKIRDFEAFCHYIIRLTSATGDERRSVGIDYWVEFNEEEASSSISSRFNPTKLNNRPVKWTSFDTGVSVNFLRDSRGEPAFSGSGGDKTQIDLALAAWTNQVNTPVSYIDAGTTTALTALKSSDKINSIVFADPNDLIAGSYNCNTGGTLAIGGWYSSGTTTFRNISFAVIVEGDIVTQDGIACLITSTGGTSLYGNMLTHELGHTLGLAHSCGDATYGSCIAGSDADNAVMRASVHYGQGANLQLDDELGIEYLYSTCYPNCARASTSTNSNPVTTRSVTTLSQITTKALPVTTKSITVTTKSLTTKTPTITTRVQPVTTKSRRVTTRRFTSSKMTADETDQNSSTTSADNRTLVSAKAKDKGFIPGLTQNNSIIVTLASSSILVLLIFFVVAKIVIKRKKTMVFIPYKDVSTNLPFKDPEMASGHAVPIAGPPKPQRVEAAVPLSVVQKSAPPPPPSRSQPSTPAQHRRDQPLTPQTSRILPTVPPRSPASTISTPSMRHPTGTPPRPPNRDDLNSPTLRRDFLPLTRGHINQ